MATTPSLERRHTLTHGNSVYWSAFSPDGQQLASASLDNTIGLWSVEAGERLDTLKGHRDGVTYVAFLPLGRLLSASLDKTIKVWNLESKEVEATFSGHQNYLSCAVVNPQATRVASGGFDNTVRVYDLNSTASLAVFTEPTSTVQSIAIANDGSRLVAGGDDQSIYIWDLNSRSLVQKLSGHTRTVEGLIYAPDDQWFASAGADGLLNVWSPEGKLLASREAPGTRFKSLSCSAKGNWLLTGDVSGRVRIWDRESLRELADVPAHRNTVFCVACNSAGTQLASASFDRSIGIWDVST